MIDSKYLKNFLLNEPHSWDKFNSLILEENRQIIEEFLEELLETDKSKFTDRRILNLVYVLGRIENIMSLQILLKLGGEFLTLKELSFELLDAIGDIVFAKDISTDLKDSIKNYLLNILKNNPNENDIFSSVAFVINNLYPELGLKDKKSLKEYNLSELENILNSN